MLLITAVNSTHWALSVEKCGNNFGCKSKQKDVAEPAAAWAGGARAGSRPLALRACSACAGDYEDPDRTAWAPDDAEVDADDAQERDAARDAATEKFPAEE
jgi:hypothetical protein